MALERPVFAAKVLTSRLACDVAILAFGAVGVGGTETFAKGVAARGTKDELVARDGVKGAEVGTIRDAIRALVSVGELKESCGDG